MLDGEQRALGLNKCYPEVTMQWSAPEITEAALALSEEERGTLAEKLVQSLDGDLDPNAEDAWAAEIERRLARIDAGQASALPMEEAIARMRRAVYKR
jgi:putative addiction module component (TIGR02574 family)